MLYLYLYLCLPFVDIICPSFFVSSLLVFHYLSLVLFAPLCVIPFSPFLTPHLSVRLSATLLEKTKRRRDNNIKMYLKNDTRVSNGFLPLLRVATSDGLFETCLPKATAAQGFGPWKRAGCTSDLV